VLVSQILKDKGDLVFTASPQETVGAAAALLHARKVGAMVVVDDKEAVVGILSERDIVRMIAKEGAGALTKPISGCMSSNGDLVKYKIHETQAEADGLKAYIAAG
jgi:CBS domain-containing protein